MVVAIIDNAQTNLLALSVTIVPARASDLVTRRHICGACCSCRSRFQAACCVSLSSTVLIALLVFALSSKSKPSASTARANKPSTGISSGKLIRARTPIPLSKRRCPCSEHRRSEPIPPPFQHPYRVPAAYPKNALETNGRCKRRPNQSWFYRPAFGANGSGTCRGSVPELFAHTPCCFNASCAQAIPSA